MAAIVPERNIDSGHDHAPVAWARAVFRPAVLVEFLFGISPLIAMVYWGWDLVLVLMLHLTALAVSAAFLVLRTACLSDVAIGYFNSGGHFQSTWSVRMLMLGLTLLAVTVPLVAMTGLLIDGVGGPLRLSVQGAGDFWQVVIVSSGLWVPLAFMAAWEAASFSADVLVPRLPFGRSFQAPERPIHPDYIGLSRELQAFLFERAWVTVRLLILIFAVPLGLILARSLGAAAVVVLLVIVKTFVAVLIEVAQGVDADRRIAAVMRRHRDARRRK